MPSPGSKQQGERSRDKLSLLRSHPLFRDLPPGVIAPDKLTAIAAEGADFDPS